MTDSDEPRYNTRVETNRWESFTRLTFTYFADEGFDVDQEFDVEDGRYILTFTDEDRDESAVFVYRGGPPDMAQESLQGLQQLFGEATRFSELWTDMVE